MAGASTNENSSNREHSQQSPGTDRWSSHEHVADSVVAEAQKLVNLAGSVELAKESLKATLEPLPQAQQVGLAKQFGYDTFEELLAASTVISLADKSIWCVTTDRSGRWAVWNLYAIDEIRRFDSRTDALASIVTDNA
jgi:hypothetical protein